jgi:hypothetical protein
VSASEGTEPRNDLWVADLTTSPLESPAFTLVQGDVDAQTGLTFLRDGRVLVSTDLDAPRGRVAVTRPGAWSPDTWTDLIAEDPEAVLESVTVLDGPELDEDLLVVVRTAHGVAHMSLHRAVDGTRHVIVTMSAALVRFCRGASSRRISAQYQQCCAKGDAMRVGIIFCSQQHGRHCAAMSAFILKSTGSSEIARKRVDLA